jgi:hypothetical protein
MTERYGERRDHPIDEPAPTLTSKARSDVWVVDRRTNSKTTGGGAGSDSSRPNVPARSNHDRQERRPMGVPPTIDVRHG